MTFSPTVAQLSALTPQQLATLRSLRGDTEAQMGFFSRVLSGITGAVKGFIGIKPAVAAIAQPIARTVGAARGFISKPGVQRLARGAALLGGAVAGGAAFEAGTGLFDAEGRPVGGPGAGGNALSFRRTIVQTVSRVDGSVIRETVERGAPFIMRRDIQIAKRVIRMASKLGRTKGLRHTVKQSVASQLSDAIKDRALAAVTKGVCS